MDMVFLFKCMKQSINLEHILSMECHKQDLKEKKNNINM